MRLPSKAEEHFYRANKKCSMKSVPVTFKPPKSPRRDEVQHIPEVRRVKAKSQSLGRFGL